MKQKMTKKYEVWLTCEQWCLMDGAYQVALSGDLNVYPTLQDAEEAWAILSNERHNREGCKVTPSDNEDIKTNYFIIKWYVYTDEKKHSHLIRTIFVKKTYYK